MLLGMRRIRKQNENEQNYSAYNNLAYHEVTLLEVMFSCDPFVDDAACNAGQSSVQTLVADRELEMVKAE